MVVIVNSDHYLFAKNACRNECTEVLHDGQEEKTARATHFEGTKDVGKMKYVKGIKGAQMMQ